MHNAYIDFFKTKIPDKSYEILFLLALNDDLHNFVMTPERYPYNQTRVIIN